MLNKRKQVAFFLSHAQALPRLQFHLLRLMRDFLKQVVLPILLCHLEFCQGLWLSKVGTHNSDVRKI